LNEMKYSYLPEIPPTIHGISNSCKVVEYFHVVKCEYELCHIPSFNFFIAGMLIFLDGTSYSQSSLF